MFGMYFFFHFSPSVEILVIVVPPFVISMILGST
jgi:hypothetical protein